MKIRRYLENEINLQRHHTVARPTIDEYFLAMAHLASWRSTCARAARGCVLVSADNHVMATGYNGTPRGTKHCYAAVPCLGAAAPSGQQLDDCLATHAEVNALLQCGNVEAVQTCYSTASPCIQCAKLLMNSGCQRLVFSIKYPDWDERVSKIWNRYYALIP